MRFADELGAGRFPVALEITPPQQRLTRVLLRRASLLGDRASAINVIHRPGRQSSLEASLELLDAGREPVWHLVTRGRSRKEIAADLETAAGGGVRQVLCIRGDHEATDAPGAPSIREVVQLAAATIPEAAIGATFNQHARDQAAALRNLLGKLASGASYVQTQPAFDLDALRTPAEAIRRESPETRIVAMVMPLRTAEAAAAVASRLGIALPQALISSLASEEAAWTTFEMQVSQLVESGVVDGLAVMTYEMDLAAEAGERILLALARAGLTAEGAFEGR